MSKTAKRTEVAQRKKKVSYYYHNDVGNYYYGKNHPMKPHRIKLTHSLVINYQLHKHLDVYEPYMATAEDMSVFHAGDYIKYLENLTPENQGEFEKESDKHNVGVMVEDCPAFQGLYKFCQYSSGGSIGAAYRLNAGTADIAINWLGGLHHAKKSEASGFCYVNDIVLSVIELLKYHQRVLYIDIDIHHGDGVEEAFYTTDRVMTLSFHKYGDFFPGTGATDDYGVGPGKNYALNFPLDDGMDDMSYKMIFEQVVNRVMECYRPGAIVVCCGADSLCGDRLGVFNMSIRGHGACIEFLKTFNKPLLLLGGGGYTVRNVARCWTYETALAVGQTLDDDLPFTEYYQYYQPGDFKLHVPVSTSQENKNSRSSLQCTTDRLFELLRELPGAPSVQFHERRKDMHPHMTKGEEDKYLISKRMHSQEFYDGDEGDRPKPTGRSLEKMEEEAVIADAEHRAALNSRSNAPR